MRIMYGDHAVVIKSAERLGKKLMFRDYDDAYYETNEYYAENIAHCKLNDLVVNGYIRVRELYKNTSSGLLLL